MAMYVKCPEHPDAALIEDYHAGDMICPECGLVVVDRCIDVSSEWRTFGNDKATKDMSRVGAAEDSILGGADLSTMIDQRGADPQAFELHKYQRKSVLTSSQKAIMKARRSIKEMGEKLTVPNDISDFAIFLFQQSRDLKKHGNRSAESIYAACLYIACRQDGTPRSFKEVCAVAGCRKKEVGRAFKSILSVLESNPEVINSSNFMGRFCANLGLPKHLVKAATEIGRKAVELDLVPGRSPISVAAAAIYMASQASESHKKTHQEISEISGVAQSTIQQCYKCLLPRADDLFPEDFKPVEKLPNN